MLTPNQIGKWAYLFSWPWEGLCGGSYFFFFFFGGCVHESYSLTHKQRGGRKGRETIADGENKRETSYIETGDHCLLNIPNLKNTVSPHLTNYFTLYNLWHKHKHKVTCMNIHHINISILRYFILLLYFISGVNIPFISLSATHVWRQNYGQNCGLLVKLARDTRAGSCI